jgi:hypothetical protein
MKREARIKVVGDRYTDMTCRRVRRCCTGGAFDEALFEQQRFRLARGQRISMSWMRATNAIVFVLRPEARK